MNLTPPEHFLKWQHAYPFSHFLNNASVADTIGGRAFKEWATRFGVPLSLPTLPILQIGPIPWNTFPFLAKSAKAFSQLLANLPPIRPPLLSFEDILAWHCTHLRSGRGHTYYCPRLIRQNKVLLHHVVGNLVNPAVLHIPHTRKSVYHRSRKRFAKGTPTSGPT